MNRIGRIHLGIVALVAPVAIAGVASADTITVTIGTDEVDIDWTSATMADLPGPDGEISLSEAFIAANHTPGHQTIGFAIPESEWQLQFLLPGRAVLTALTGYFLHADEEVTIDGTTQTAFTGDTNPDGHEVALYGHGLGLNADNCTLIGFDSTAVSVTGSSCLVQGNTGSMNITVFGGSGSVFEDNTGGTIKIDRSNDNIIVGNTINRVRVLGAGGAQPAANNRIGGPHPEDRNFITGYGTWNSEGLPAGAAIQLVWADGTLIENNSIGTTPDGLEQGNLACTMGISFEGENHDVTVRDNRIAGILGHGMGPHHAGQLFGWAIYFWGSTSNIDIVNNTIGLNALGEPSLGSVWGVNVDNFSFYTVDGVSLVDNVIAGHIFNGIRVGPTATMRISGTEVYDNGWLGIDLIGTSFASGVTPNDLLDVDTGGNGLQNFPVLDGASPGAESLHIVGSLHSSPSDGFTLEFFASPVCDESGFGQGQMFLGSARVTTDGAGDADFDITLDATIAEGWLITATATLEPIGATSEFSACLAVEGGMLGDLDGDGAVTFNDLLILLAAWGPCGSGPCDADLDSSGDVGFADLLMLLASWS